MSSHYDEPAIEPESEEERRPLRSQCTPSSLLAWLKEFHSKNGRSPTLGECKHQFGGILGPMICSWALEKQGLAKNGVPTEFLK